MGKILKILRNIVPRFLISGYHFLWAFFSATFFGFPSSKIKVIGITGTSGKTTTIELTSRILEEAGYKTAILSSIKFRINGKEKENKLRMTMPGRAIIQKFLAQAVRAGCDYAILEVTSEGVVQHRHRFIDFEAGVFLNLSPEHIESHGSFENYRKAKIRFFKKAKKIHILNADDENIEHFSELLADKKYFYGIRDGEQDFKTKTQNIELVEAREYKSLSTGLRFYINNTEFNLSLLGKFNIYNALAGICVGLSQKVDLETCSKALEKVIGMPGRMELVIKEPFKVFVDYAITPNALGQVYQIMSKFKLPSNGKPDSKMICVLGSCGGGRDRWKRPILGKLAARYCDKVIITNEDPYDEDPKQILLEIKSGIPNKEISITSLILDRREAIKKALELARQGDVVIITGKGCEPSICLANNQKIPWDDREVVRQEFKKI